MAASRIFISQDTLDNWLTNGRVEVEGDTMTLVPEGNRFKIRTAVHLTSEIAGGGDEQKLVGRVKDLEALVEIGAEHAHTSVILDDNAYEVVEGFLGESLDAAPVQAPGEGTAELDLLARFFMSES